MNVVPGVMISIKLTNDKLAPRESHCHEKDVNTCPNPDLANIHLSTIVVILQLCNSCILYFLPAFNIY